MNIFCLSDSHGEVPEMPPNIDMALICGDFSEFGSRAERIFQRLSKRGIPVFFTSGNHETPYLCEDIAMEPTYAAAYIDYGWAIFDDLLLVGIGGYDLFSHLQRSRRITDFGRKLSCLPRNRVPKRSLLLSHEPPWPWKYAGRVQGSEDIREILLTWSFDLILIGHLHEESPRLVRDSVIAPTLNPSGRGCVIELDPADGECRLVWPK